jgi:NADPH:quinone reductase-like Zn-dependent oxidoreductase
VATIEQSTKQLMRAAWRERWGGPEVVEMRDIEKPTPGRDEVLVRLHAASVNRVDLDTLIPEPAIMRVFLGPRRPRQKRIGVDAAGVVEAVGEGVTRFKVGDRVFADLYTSGAGAFAEYVTAPAKAWLPITDGIAFETAATLPHSANLAIQGLRLGNGRTVGQGDRLLVVGASGNVGPFIVQLAKARGAHVTAVGNGDKADFMRSLGADEVIDYRTTDYTRPAEPYDWIVDVHAHHSLGRWRKALKPRGVYQAMGGTGWWLLSLAVLQPVYKLATRKTMGLMLSWKPFKQEDIEELLRLVESGTLQPQIDRRFPLEEVPAAIAWVHDGKARGKVLVTF